MCVRSKRLQYSVQQMKQYFVKGVIIRCTMPTSLLANIFVFLYFTLPSRKVLFVTFAKRNGHSCSAEKTEQSYAENVTFQYIKQMNTPKATVDISYLELNFQRPQAHTLLLLLAHLPPLRLTHHKLSHLLLSLAMIMTCLTNTPTPQPLHQRRRRRQQTIINSMKRVYQST